jgi:hypothetical protein
LPPELERTLEQWLSEGAARIGLAEFLHGVAEDEKETSPVHAFLERLATNSRLDFFSQATGSQPDYDAEGFWISGPLTPTASRLGPDLLEATVPCRNCGLGE